MLKEDKNEVPPQDFQDLHYELSRWSVFGQTIREGSFPGSKCTVVKDLIDHFKAFYDETFVKYTAHPYYKKYQADKEDAEASKQ